MSEVPSVSAVGSRGQVAGGERMPDPTLMDVLETCAPVLWALVVVALAVLWTVAADVEGL